MPTNILYPDIPVYPGVPAIVRPLSSAIASSPVLAISLGTISGILGQSLQQAPRWGIFTAAGAQLGIATAGNPVVNALATQVTGIASAVLSTLGFEFVKESRVSDFATEGGLFTTYNKVRTSNNPTVMLALSGSESDRSYFLKALEEACDSTDAYNIVTPERTYVNYTIERITGPQRRASNGVTLLIVEVTLKEIRTVSASYATVAPIVSPVDPSATSSVDGGKVQAKAADTSTLKSLAGKLGF